MDGRFLNYQLLSDGFIKEVDSLTYGAKMPRASGEQLGNLPVAVPPLGEQIVLAAHLDRETAKIDALIAKKQRLIALLQEKRAAMISTAVTRGLDPDVPMRDSGIPWMGLVPAHWRIKRLKHLSGCITGIAVSPSTLVADEGSPYLYGGDINDGTGRLKWRPLHQ